MLHLCCRLFDYRIIFSKHNQAFKPEEFMSSLEIEEQVITEKHIPVDMEAYIKFKLGLQLSSGQEGENSQPEEESAEQVRAVFRSIAAFILDRCKSVSDFTLTGRFTLGLQS